MEVELVKVIFSYLGVGGVSLAFAFFAIKGMMSLKSEKNAQAPNEIYNNQLETFRKIAHDANVRADTFAAERNELLVKVTRVEAEVARLGDVVVQNDRLRTIVDQKDASIRLMIANFTDTIQQTLTMMQEKDRILIAQTAQIAKLEADVANMKEQLARGPQPNGTVTTTVTTAQ